MDFIANLHLVHTQSRRIEEGLQCLENQFKTVGNNKDISLDSFQKIIKSKNPFFVERVFKLFDWDASDTISKEEFMGSIRAIIGRPPDDKLRFLFQVYDIDGDGYLSLDELRHVMKICMEENGLNFTETEIDDLTQTLFESADFDESGTVCFDEFQSLLYRHTGLIENLSLSVERWLLPPPPEEFRRDRFRKCVPRKLRWSHITNNSVSVVFFVTYLAINLILFVTRTMEYKDLGPNVMMARAGGQCLNFNSTFILILMLRRCITFLRSVGFSEYLPLDQHIYYHKVVGWFIAIYAVIHSAGHVLNFWQLSKVTGIPLVELLFETKFGIGWVAGAACTTGWVLIAILLIMVVTSQSFMRRKGKFEVFYYCHLLYIAYWGILIIHAPVFWQWFLAPGIVFVIEGIHRLKTSFGSHGDTYIQKGVLLPSRVVHLVIKRPPNFDFHPGDFIYVQIPGIAAAEWHPFTISSAPEMEDVLWLHIRAVGEWSNRVHDYFAKQDDLREVCSTISEATGQFNPAGIMDGSISAQNDSKIYSLKKSIVRISKFLVLLSGDQNETIHTESPMSYIAKPVACLPAKTDSPLTHLTEQAIVNAQPKAPVKLKPTLSNASRRPKLARRVTICEFRPTKNGSPLSPHCVTVATPALSRRLSTVSAIWSTNKGLFRRKSTVFVLPSPVTRHNSTYGRQRLSFDGDDGEVAMDMKPDPSKWKQGSEPYSPVSVKSAQVECGQVIRIPKPVSVRIDGPYGSPSSHIFHTQHAVMISTGIGVTPFASILQSIMMRYCEARHKCPSCDHSWSDPVPPTVMKLRKVDFVWINREQKCFEWFVNLLSELEITQAEIKETLDRFLDIHVFITSALDKADMKAIGLHLALDLMHEKNKRDLITGLKTRTQPGRPKWNKFFRDIAAQNKGRVTVFFCGPPELGRQLHTHCNQFGFAFRKESF